MIRLRLCFPRTPDPDAFAAVCGALAGARAGVPRVLVPTSREALFDPNPGASACVDARWTGPGATLHLRIEGGPGDPREGFGYVGSALLTVDDPEGGWEARVSIDHWEPIPSPLPVTVVGLPLASYAAVRATLASSPGGAIDGSADASTALAMIPVLLAAGEVAQARDLAVEALAQATPASGGHGELLDWALRLDPSLGGLSRRLRETPARLPAWEEALAAPPDGFAPADLRAAMAHLCPMDGDRWAAAGLPLPPWLSAPDWPVGPARRVDDAPWWTLSPVAGHSITAAHDFLRALTGDTYDADAETVPPVAGVDGWRWWVTRRARWPEGARLPRAVVTLEAERPAAVGGGMNDTQTWEWVSGPEPGDVAVSLRRRWPRAPGLDEAFAWSVVGSAAFRDAVRAAWEVAVPYRWEPIALADLRLPRPARQLPWFTGLSEAAPVAIAERVLAASNLTPDHQALALAQLSCRCVQGRSPPCPHRSALLDLGRAQVALRVSLGKADRLRTQARQQVLQVALHAIGASPDVEQVHRALRIGHALLLEVDSLR